METNKKFNIDEKKSLDFARRFRPRVAKVLNDSFEIDP